MISFDLSNFCQFIIDTYSVNARNVRMKNSIYVIDGTAIIYRSYFAFKNRPLINSRGENTSAIFGFCVRSYLCSSVLNQSILQ